MGKRVTVVCDPMGRISAVLGRRHRVFEVRLPAELEKANEEDQVFTELLRNYGVCVDSAGAYLVKLRGSSASTASIDA